MVEQNQSNKKGGHILMFHRRKEALPQIKILDDFIETAIKEINPVPLEPNETFNRKAMMTEYVVSTLYLDAISRLILDGQNNGKAYDLQQFKADFTAFTASDKVDIKEIMAKIYGNGDLQ